MNVKSLFPVNFESLKIEKGVSKHFSLEGHFVEKKKIKSRLNFGVLRLCWVYFVVSRGATYSIGQLDHRELDRHPTFPH